MHSHFDHAPKAALTANPPPTVAWKTEKGIDTQKLMRAWSLAHPTRACAGRGVSVSESSQD